MKRRSAIKKLGISTVGVGSIVGVLGANSVVYSLSNSVEIKVFQEDKVTEFLEENSLGGDFFIYTLINNLPQIISEAFQEVRVSADEGRRDISMRNQSKSLLSGVNLQRENVEWGRKAESSSEIDTVTHSNILIRSMPNVDRGRMKYAGNGIGPIMPSCCRVYNGFSTIWVDLKKASFNGIQTLACHEIGHNLGLVHGYGAAVGEEEEYASVMLTDNYIKNHKTNIFGQKLPEGQIKPGKFRPTFNSKLTTKQLRI